ncbi:MAG: UDP-N-acetyl-D-glucosamine dehydrogenase, partial [Nitrospirae bacterium]|nr:UDP-N-acetyl-D-glucosamine dehydrogenase [Nitrospirota bacterium]
MTLLDKIKNHSAVVGVVGLGYVGLPLAVLQAKTGYRVIGIEDRTEKVNLVNQGSNYISDVDSAELQHVVEAKQFVATTDFAKLEECDVV